MCKVRRMMQMMQWFAAVLSLGLFLCMGGLQGVAAAAEKAPIHWRLQSVFPATSLANTLAKNFSEDVKKRTNGRVEVELFYAGALAKPLETFDAVAAGSVDLAVSGGVYHTRKVPEALFEFGLSYSFQNQDQAYEFYYDYKGAEALKILREGYEKRGTYLLALGPAGDYYFLTKFPVGSIDDFKNKKIRSFGLLSVLVQKLGAAPVSITSSEMYLALQRGTADGTVYVPASLETYKLKEVVDYVVGPPILSCLIEFYVNLKTWQKLPDDLKNIVEKSLCENFRSYSKAALEQDMESLESAKKAGVKLITLRDNEAKQLQGLAVSTWDIAAKKSEGSARLVELLKEYLRGKGALP